MKTKNKNIKENNLQINTVDASESALNFTSESAPRKQRRLHTYERARLMYEKIQAERHLQAETRRIEREKRRKAWEDYLSKKKKMNLALLKRNKRGQPNLNAQVKVLLETIEKRILS